MLDNMFIYIHVYCFSIFTDPIQEPSCDWAFLAAPPAPIDDIPTRFDDFV